MKKKIAGIIIVSASLFVSIFTTAKNENRIHIKNLVLADIESLATCEASSSNLANTGYCVKIKDSSEEVCADQGSVSSPRCSGTI